MRKSLLLLSLVSSLWAGIAGALTLEGTTDALEVVTSSTATLDWHVSLASVGATALNGPDALQGQISSATTTTIVAAPGASTWYYIREATLTNTHASTSVDVTVQVDRSGTDRRQAKATLAAGERLALGEDGHWRKFDSQGREQTSVQNTGAVAGTINTVVLATDQGNSNATLNTLEDVTGLSFTVNSGETYWWRCTIAYTAAATTTGSRWTMSGPAATRLNYTSSYTLTATTETVNYATAYSIPAASNASSLTAGNVAVIEGVVTPSAGGTMQVTHASEVAGSLINALAGSYCEWVRTL